MSTILGPDGAPLITSERQARELSRTPLAGEVLPVAAGGASRQVTFDEAVNLVKDGRALTAPQLVNMGAIGDPETVEKKVRSQAVSMSYIWDRNRGKPKPTPVTWETLRLMANRSEWVRAIIKTRKNQIAECKWGFIPKRDGDQTPETEAMIQDLTRLLTRPSMRGSKPHSRGWREFFGMLLEDVLVLDAAAIEKERNYAKWIVAMYPVDGSTIKPNIDEQGGYYDDAYVQEVDGVITARFGMEDLIYMMDNPQTDVRFAGYGLSPLENLITSVTAELYASKYNATYFEKGAVPEGILNLGEDVPPEDVDAFRLYWMNEIMGRPWAIPILGGKGVEWVQWRDNHRDMQFMEYQNWLVKKLCAVYQLTPQEIGLIEDVNRSTAESQDDSNESKSIEPIKLMIADYFEVELVGEHGQGVGDYVEFAWEEDGESAEEVNAKFQQAVEDGAATREEWRAALGLDTPEEGTPGAEGLGMFLTSGELKPLPTKEDADLLSVANQQQREDQQTQQQQEGAGPASDMQWKPGDANDPATRGAMQAHDDEHGIGPRNDQPPPPVGKTGKGTFHIGWMNHNTGRTHCLDCGPRKGWNMKALTAPVQHGSGTCDNCGGGLPGHALNGCEHCQTVGKVAPDGRDRHPALTARQDDLADVLRVRNQELMGGLATILELPEPELEPEVEEVAG